MLTFSPSVLINMEVLKNGICLKDAEKQHAMSNLGCRTPRELTPGTNVARSKGEMDVARLIACKAQLSAEVIRWKTESLKLQKERDAARQKVKELDQSVLKISEKAKELETRLILCEQEKIQLRTKSLLSNDELVLHHAEKYHSFPWTEKYHSFPSEEEQEKEEDWKEMSHKIMEKMKEEMMELQELGNHFSLPQKVDQSVPAEMEEMVSNLLCQARELKNSFFHQNQKLQHLLNSLLDNIEGNPKIKLEAKDKSFAPRPKPLINFSRPSDESFRDYFTKQLEGMHEVDKMTEAMQLFLQTEEARLKKTNELKQSACQHSNVDLEVRVCPICHVSFSGNILQKEFEEHVVDHLEAESASLLDQYVVL